MLIRNYGLFWSREKIWWGSGGKGNAGRLLGKKRGAKRTEPVDFREQRGVYVLKQHRVDHLAERWKLFSWFGTRSVSGNELAKQDEITPSLSDALNHIEAVMLASTEPPLNLQRGRFGGEVHQYLQFQNDSEEGE